MGFWSSIVGIIGVVAAPFTGGASLLLTAAAVVAPKVIDKVVDFVMKPFLGMMGMPNMDISATAEAERQQGVSLQRQGSMSSIPVVYGFRQVGAAITFSETGATDNKYLWVANVYSEGPVAGLKKLYIDDNELPAGTATKLNNGQIVEITEGKYAGRVKLQFFKGDYYTNPNSPANPIRTTCFFNTDTDRPPNWSNTMVYNGLAVIFARYEWKKITTQAEADANPFGGKIPELKVEMFGKIISAIPSTQPANEYDSDPARYQIITTSAGDTIGYTNPAEVLLDYLRNPRYGKGLKNADIDWPSWYIAAQKCRTEVTYVAGIKGPIMDMNFVLATEQTIFNNVKTLLSNFRAYMPYVQGKYKLKIEDAGDPTDITSGSATIVAEFDKTNIIDEIVYTGIERTSKYNQVVVTWVDPDNKWSNQEVVYPETEAERQVFIDQDGGRENKGSFTASGITNVIMAKDMARILFWKSRVSDTVSLTVSSRGLELEPGDCIHIAGNQLLLDTTYPYRVVSTTLNNDMTVKVGCVFNPDYIFPYTRWGEPDKVLPVYVPKGAERYYPVITPNEKNGLLKPYPNKPESPTSGVPTSALNDIITITSIKFISMDTNPVETSSNVYAVIEYPQPNTSLYYSTKLYWKEDAASATTWLETESVRQPGPGKTISTQFGPVVYGKTYVLNSRVMYQSNQPSVNLGTYRFTVTNSITNPITGGGTGTNTGTPGTPNTPPTNLADNFLASVVGITLLDGSYPNQIPKNPRQIQVTVKQDMAAGNNAYLDTLEIFYKPSANPKWTYMTQSLLGAQGTDISFILSLGARLYPLRPGYNNEAPAKADDYDFIFRFAYNDGKSSIYQYRAMNVSIEWNGLTWGPYNPFALTGVGTVLYPKELSANYIPEIAGPNDIVETRNIKIGSAYSVRDNGNSPNPIAARFFFDPPITADQVNWRGLRVYRHKAGEAGIGDSVDFTPATSSSGLWSVLVTGITYDDVWEYVLVPLVTYGTDTVESNYAQYLAGFIHNRGSDANYPSDANWYPNFKTIGVEDKSTAISKLGSAAPAAPRKDTQLASFSSSTVLTGGNPSSPRKLSFTFTQQVSGTNTRIAGLVIYYKQSDSQYWKKSKYPLTSYTEGNPITFNTAQTTPVMDLGYPIYPTIPGREQLYDFTVRFYYDDGSESLKESWWTQKYVERDGSGSYSFAPLGPTSITNIRNSTVLVTEDQAPPGAVLDVRDILTSTSMAPFALEVLDTNNTLRFGFTPPITQLKGYLAGYRILRREIISGSNPAFSTDDSNIPYGTGIAVNNLGVYQDIVTASSTNTTWNKQYEWVVIPMVWYQGQRVEANNAVYWKGAVCNQTNSLPSNPWTSNWYSRTPSLITTTADAKVRLSTAFAATAPTVNVTSITRTNLAFAQTGGDALGYWTVTYNVPANFVSAKIYRRQCHDPLDSTYGTYGTYQRAADFGGAGQWEVFTVNNTSNPVTNGAQSINVRPAIGDYFNDTSQQYGLNPTLAKTTTVGSSNTLYRNGQIVPPGTGNTVASKYWLAGDKSHAVSQDGMITQLLIVITTTVNGNPVESANGMIVNLYNTPLVNSIATRNGPGDVTRDTLQVSVADLNASLDISKLNLSAYSGATLDPSWTTLLRKPSEAIAAPSASAIVQPGTTGYSTAYTLPISGAY